MWGERYEDQCHYIVHAAVQGFVNNVGAIFQCDTAADGAVGVTLQRGAFSGGNSWRAESDSAAWKLAAESERLPGKSPSPCQDSREATSSEEPTDDTFRQHSVVSPDPHLHCTYPPLHSNVSP